MRAALVDSEGNVTGRGSIGTFPENGIEDATERLADLLENAKRSAPKDIEFVGVGVSTAGPLQPATGTYNHPPNLTGWHGKTLKPSLSQSLGLMVSIGHDATLAALAETRFGDHIGAKNLVYVTISTGVGGGIIANGEMVTGATGGAGEVGHIYVCPGAYECNVGCDGCFEGNASGPAIARAARDKFIIGSPLAKLAHGNPENITSKMVFDAADQGDTSAQEIVNTTIDNIGIGLASLVNTLDPEAIVIGGGVVLGLERHWDKLHASVLKRVIPRYEEVPLTATRLGDDIGLLGAAQLAFREAVRS